MTTRDDVEPGVALLGREGRRPRRRCQLAEPVQQRHWRFEAGMQCPFSLWPMVVSKACPSEHAGALPALTPMFDDPLHSPVRAPPLPPLLSLQNLAAWYDRFAQQAASWGLAGVQYDLSAGYFDRFIKPFSTTVATELQLFPFLKQVRWGG